MQSNQVIKLGVALVLVIAAIFWYGSRMSDDIPDDPQSKTWFMCSECKFPEQLSDRKFNDRKQATALAQQSDAQGQGGKPRIGRAAQQTMILKCSQCGKYTERPATKCPKDGEIVIAKTDDGSPGKCPKCGWVVGTPAPRS